MTQNILKHNQVNPNEKLKFPSAIDLHKLLVATVKPENPLAAVAFRRATAEKLAGGTTKFPLLAPQYALKALRDGWDRCFKKISKQPQFKRKGQHDSFILDGTIKVLGLNHIQVPVIGVLKTFEALPQGKPKNVTISRQSDKWFISFTPVLSLLENNN